MIRKLLNKLKNIFASVPDKKEEMEQKYRELNSKFSHTHSLSSISGYYLADGGAYAQSDKNTYS